MIKLLQSLNLSSPPPGEEEEGEEEEESAEGDDAKVNEEDIKKLLERMGSVSSLGAPGRVPVLGVSEAEAMEEDAEIVRSSKPSAGLLSLPTANSKGTKAGGSVSGSSFGGTSLDVLASSSAVGIPPFSLLVASCSVCRYRVHLVLTKQLVCGVGCRSHRRKRKLRWRIWTRRRRTRRVKKEKWWRLVKMNSWPWFVILEALFFLKATILFVPSCWMSHRPTLDECSILTS